MSNWCKRLLVWPRQPMLVGGALFALLPIAIAQAGESRAIDDHQRWQRESAATVMTGFWEGVMEPEDERFRRLGPSGGPNLGEFTGLYFTEAGLKKAQTWSPDDEYLPENIGKSQIVPTIMTTPFPVKFEFGEQQVTIRLTECDNVRTVALSGSPQQKVAAPAEVGTAMGVSTGHWDGATLVIRTTGIRAGQVRANGAPQSADAVVTERYGLVGGYLVGILIIEDPLYYTRPVTRVIAYRKRNDLKELEEYGSCS